MARPTPALRPQAGLTLIEMMVALVIGLLIVLAAMTALSISRQGFAALDAAAQMRDNGRFAAELIQRLTTQAGYTDVQYIRVNNYFDPDQSVPLAVQGFSNAKPPGGTDNPFNDLANDSRSSKCAGDAACAAGGDVLVLRFQPSGRNVTSKNKDGDGAIVNCAGAKINWVPGSAGDRSASVLYVDTSKGEPTLMCKYQVNDGTGNWAKPAPLIQGVERMELMFGVTDVDAKTASLPIAPTDSDTPTRYLNASDLIVTGNAAATNNNWRRVRSVRVGLVLRSPANSALENKTIALKPLGFGDAPSFTPVNSDRRLRQVVTFTVHLRNYQGT